MMQTQTGDPRGSWFWPVMLATAVFFASGRSTVASPGWIGTDKAAHFFVFGLLGMLIARTQPRGRWWLGWLVATLYGAADEWRQSFTPGRFVEVADWVADTLGAAVGVAVYAKWTAFRALLETRLAGRRDPSVANSADAVPDRGDVSPQS